MLREKIYIDRDNINRLLFRRNGQIINLGPLTKIDLVIEKLGITITNSTSDAYPLKWLHDPVETGILGLQIGGTTDLKEGVYKARLYAYESGSPNGKFWCEIELHIKD
jgi:hypothetical protein